MGSHRNESIHDFPPVRAKRPFAKHRPEIGATRHSASRAKQNSLFALWIDQSQTGSIDHRWSFALCIDRPEKGRSTSR
jgi:hypothetical protein